MPAADASRDASHWVGRISHTTIQFLNVKVQLHTSTTTNMRAAGNEDVNCPPAMWGQVNSAAFANCVL